MSASSSASSSPPGFNPSQSPNYSFTRPRAPSPYMRTLLTYIDAVNNRDFGAVNAVFDESLEHRILPKSLGRPVLNKKQYHDYLRGIMALMAKFETKLHEVIEAGDKLTAHGSSKGESISGTPYANEYTLIIHFAPVAEGQELPKMRLVKEFVDSSVSVKFFTEERVRNREKHAKDRGKI